ncbi:hypothetical protein XELAEV_18002540mg [Xenopus laevis]|nr:hypothetical protein XELAEV_18002540mg [Xenopus laevis]
MFYSTQSYGVIMDTYLSFTQLGHLLLLCIPSQALLHLVLIVPAYWILHMLICYYMHISKMYSSALPTHTY